MINHKLYQEDLQLINALELPWDRLEGSSILITGANGLICSVMVDAFLYRNEINNSNINIWVLSRNEATLRQKFGKYFDKKYFHYILQDVTDKIVIEAPIDYIIHGASKGDPLSFATDPVGIMNANYIGMYQVLELAREKKAKKVLYISSGEVYGTVNKEVLEDHEKGICEKEFGYLDITNVRSSYASSKKAAETLCVAYGRQFGIDVSIARPCHTYGATMLQTDSRVIGEFIRCAINHSDIIMKSQGLQERSYCYVTDTVAAFLYLLLFGQGGEAYNIANKNSVISIRGLAEMITDIANSKIQYAIPEELEKAGYSSIMHAVLNASKLEALGWFPRVTIQEGIHRTIQILEAIDNSN